MTTISRLRAEVNAVSIEGWTLQGFAVAPRGRSKGNSTQAQDVLFNAGIMNRITLPRAALQALGTPSAAVILVNTAKRLIVIFPSVPGAPDAMQLTRSGRESLQSWIHNAAAFRALGLGPNLARGLYAPCHAERGAIVVGPIPETKEAN